VSRQIRVAIAVLSILVVACASSSDSPISMIPDPRVQRIVEAAFAAHGPYQDFLAARGLSFDVAATGTIATEVGRVLSAQVELVSQPRSRWNTPYGLIEIDRPHRILLQPTELDRRVSAETAQLLSLTSLLVVMPLPLTSSAAPPTYLGSGEIDGEEWDVLALVPADLGLTFLQSLKVYLRRKTGRAEMMLADFGTNRLRWIQGFRPRRVQNLTVISDVRWCQGGAGELIGDRMAELALNELCSWPDRPSFPGPWASAAAQ
jgi:hypothetical protein